MQNCKNIVDDIRTNINEETANKWTENNLVNYTCKAISYVQALIRGIDNGYYLKYKKVSSVADQDEYDIPNGILTVRSIQDIETDEEYPVQEHPMRLINMPKDNGILFKGHQFVVRPIPTNSVTDRWKVWYMWEHPKIHYGTAATSDTPANTVLTFPASPYGRIVHIDDYYKDLQIEVYEHNSATISDIRRITAYDKATREITPDTAFSITPDNTTKYALIPYLPQKAIDLVILKATIKALQKEQIQDLKVWYIDLQETKKELKQILNERQTQENTRIDDVAW